MWGNACVTFTGYFFFMETEYKGKKNTQKMFEPTHKYITVARLKSSLIRFPSFLFAVVKSFFFVWNYFVNVMDCLQQPIIVLNGLAILFSHINYRTCNALNFNLNLFNLPFDLFIYDGCQYAANDEKLISLNGLSWKIQTNRLMN